MSFVMIAAGSSSGSRLRTLSLTALLLGAALAACVLLATGFGLGHWVTRWDAAAAPPPAAPLMPFAVEQLGALSARLFKLESQARQLAERLGPARVAEPAAVKEPVTGATVSANQSGRGGPLLPPLPELEAHDLIGTLQVRLADLDQQISRTSDAAALQNLAQMRLPTRAPIDGAEVVSHFGNRDDPLTGRRAFHGGIDFKARPGTDIQAAAGGVVTWSGFKADFGRVVEIDHGNGLVTRYAHASELHVKVGDVVTPGDRIAAVGTSGRSTGPHLHFEVLKRGEATDPRHYLAERAGQRAGH